MEFRVEDRNNEQDYHTYNSNDYDNDSQNFSITYRKYLGTDCKTSKENVQIKQQLELMKMCGRGLIVILVLALMKTLLTCI